MDPNTTLARYIAAAVEGDTETMAEADADLMHWLVTGGFPPTDPRKEAYQAGRADQRHEFGME